MEPIKILYAYLNRQQIIIKNLYQEVLKLDLNDYNQQYVFALKTQQLYTAVEDMLKSSAVTFENHIDSPQSFHIELLKRMNLDIEGVRPAIIHDESFKLLNKLRAFRHFIRHAYDYELDKEELILVQKKIESSFAFVISDIKSFELFLENLLKLENSV